MSPSSAESYAFRRTRQIALAIGGQGKKMYYTYVLFCQNTKTGKKMFYTGSTEDIEERELDHKTKSVETTKGFNKINLVYYEACFNKTDARKRELQLKTGFGRGYLKRRLEGYLKSTRV